MAPKDLPTMATRNSLLVPAGMVVGGVSCVVYAYVTYYSCSTARV